MAPGRAQGPPPLDELGELGFDVDEVARASVRSQTVTEIDAFAARPATSRTSPQLIVTTRPNASGLPEPFTELFDVLALVKPSPELRAAYLRKWADDRSIHGAERRALQRTFDHRSAEPHIAQLAENPMHLTIPLYLMYKRGESVPSRRTDLYRSYMETFLDRETEKSPMVRTHRGDLEQESTPRPTRPSNADWSPRCWTACAQNDRRST
ncbi:hypothetical protein AB0J28_29030 [Streptosporangium canum]|uniref:NACHT domain-containing protein n=1 Tax=Streptosporangium canum TaxID=324952 RepID=UPI00343C379D